MMEIRKTTMADLGRAMELYAMARQFMKDHGNPTQWGDNHPPKEQIIDDIQRGRSYLCVEDGQVLGIFYFSVEQEPNYASIYEGAWANEEPYGVVHRITSDGSVKGAGSFCLQWAFLQCKNLKIDTHRDNVVMQNLLKKNGFQYCGIIHIRNGEERLAYQKGPDGRQIPKSIER